MPTRKLVLILFILWLITAGIIFGSIALADGVLEPISTSGVATGWAMDAKFPNGKESVWLYDKAKPSGGKLLGIVQANLPSPDVPAQGTRRFSFNLPLSVKDGALHTIFAYRAGSELLATPREFIFGERPGITLSQAALTFGNQTTGATSAVQTVTVTSSGNLPLTISAIVTTGEYITASQCAGPVAPGQSCPFAVSFAPKSAGNRAGSISIESNAPGSPHLITLAGVGVNVSASSPSIESFYDAVTTDYQVNYTINLAAYPSVMVILNDKTIFTQGEPFTPRVFVVPVGFYADFGLLSQIDPSIDPARQRAAFKISFPIVGYRKFTVSLNGNVVFTK